MKNKYSCGHAAASLPKATTDAQKFVFFGGAGAAQHCIAARKTAESNNYGLVLGCKVKVACSLCLSPVGTSARNREKQATQLSCKARASACINRIYKKNLADPLQLLNFVLGQCLQRQLAGACIAAKSPSRTVKDVAAELVQQDYQGQAAVQWLFPRRQPALQRLLSSLAKACAYFLVERGAARKPAFVQVA